MLYSLIAALAKQHQTLLQVPDRGTVAGVMWYFPAEHEVETLPLATTTLAQRPISTFNMTQHDPAAAAPGRATQQPQLTQLGGGDAAGRKTAWSRPIQSLRGG